MFKKYRMFKKYKILKYNIQNNLYIKIQNVKNISCIYYIYFVGTRIIYI